jgi:UDP-N-acetylmuramoyl-tripeptide--D-alanyl-D-alanine ligase
MLLSAAEMRTLLGLPPGDDHRRPAGLCIDSRALQPGQVFLALQGERSDGHAFVAEALQAGALAVIADPGRLPAALAADGRLWPATGGREALQALAAGTRARFRGPLVAITGSNGKTGTKEALRTLLAEERRVAASPGNLNSTVGAPLALVNHLPGDGVYILEAGASDFGEIRRICATARPTHGCITNIDLAHLDRFGDRDGVARAKWELWEYLAGQGGHAVVNADDPLVLEGSKNNPRRSRFSLAAGEAGAGVRVGILGMDGEARARIRLAGEELSLALPGRAWLECAFAALAIALVLGLPPRAAARGLARPLSLPSRMTLLRLRGAQLIDDSYNANPASMRAALATLAGLPATGKRIAVLGGMNELGGNSAELHRELGRWAAALGLDEFLLVGAGPDLEALAEGLRSGGSTPVSRVDGPAGAAAALAGIGMGDAVLLKGSRGYALERVLEALS